jgi:isoleucyl-tRNA synthetase
VWTTTPWTLTANVACAVSPDLVYLRVRQEESCYYLAASRAGEVMTDESPWRVEAELPGQDLVGFRYGGPFDDLPQEREAAAAHMVLAWSKVSGAEGTGIVHVAPGCGKEDYDLGREHGLPVVAPIDENGRFLAAAGPLVGIQASEAAEAVLEALRRRGLLYRVDAYQHRYPHCWRCGSEVLFRLVDEWFIAMDPWREEIMRLTREVHWVPDYGREVELDWLRNMRDWMISKKRYWGLALPIWRCECGWFDVIGGREDLRQRAVEGWEEFSGHSPHRPWVDAVKIKCGGCGGQASRIPDVGNPWLDAGIVPYSTMGYFRDREEWERWFPAELVIESLPGQFRNWFYVLLAMSAMLEGRKPVGTITGYSTVLDEHGEEMHKSKGNAIWFAEAADAIGADPIRWLSASQPLTQPMRFGLGKAEEVRDCLRTLWNVYSFLATYANVDGWPRPGTAAPGGESPSDLPLDRWLRARVAVAAGEISEAVETFAAPRATAALLALLDALSNWWVRRSRRRFWKSGSDADKEAAYRSLHGALVNFSCLLAPFLPFTAEALYQRLRAPCGYSMPESVHLCAPPTAVVSGDDSALLEECEKARTVVRLGRSLRAKLAIRVRQPLSRVLILDSDTPDGSAFAHFGLDVLEELNVKEVQFMPTGDELGPTVAEEANLVVGLDTTLTNELVQEGIVRDLIRHIQHLRKQAGLHVDQRIKLWVRDGPPLLEEALQINGDHLAGEVLATAVNEGAEPLESVRSDCRIAGERVTLALVPA